MPIAQIRKAKLEDALGIGFVHVRFRQVAYAVREVRYRLNLRATY